jgi:putative addiction module component (TIGR02574 family)
MKASYESIMDAALQLDDADRRRVAAHLWDSIGKPLPHLEETELDDLLDRREAELDQDSSLEMSHDEFMASFLHRRRA